MCKELPVLRFMIEEKFIAIIYMYIYTILYNAKNRCKTYR